MRLPPDEIDRFFRVWFALLNYANTERQLGLTLPAARGQGSVAMTDVATLCEVIWGDAVLRAAFREDNPARLSATDLALVESWEDRLAGDFYVFRYLKRHTVLLSSTGTPRAYGVLGLMSTFAEVLGPRLPISVRVTLLPFEGRITYDGLLRPYNVIYGPGIRRSLNEAYEEAKAREGIITALPAPPPPPPIRPRRPARLGG